jgi:hypothetical protein
MLQKEPKNDKESKDSKFPIALDHIFVLDA